MSNNLIYVFLQESSKSELHTFFIDPSTSKIKYSSAMRTPDVDIFDVISKNTQTVVIAQFGAYFKQIVYSTSSPLHPAVSALSSSLKFYSNSMKCNSDSGLCVCDTSNNVLYGIYPLGASVNEDMRVVVFEKYNDYNNLVESNSNIAVARDFIGYLGLKSNFDKTEQTFSLNISVILYDIRSI
jgi:hypothetical protein